MGSKQFDCPITFTAFQMTSKPNADVDVVCIRGHQAKFALVCFCSIGQLNVLHFCLRSVSTFIFQGHIKVALALISILKGLNKSSSWRFV